MFWIADVFTGTNSQNWGKGDGRIDASAERAGVESSDRRSKPTRGALTRMLGAFVETHQRYVAARNLRRLNDHMLRDIGITRADIDAIVSNPALRQSREASPHILYRPSRARLMRSRAAANAATTQAVELQRADDPPAADCTDKIRRAA